MCNIYIYIENVQRYSEAVWVGFSEQNGDGATVAAEVEQLEPEVGGSTSRLLRRGAEMGLDSGLLYSYNDYTHIILIQHIYIYIYIYIGCSLKLGTTYLIFMLRC